MPKRILIVDDNPETRKAMRWVFENHGGWEVCGEAGDGQEAIVKARQLQPNLITIDYAMPTMDGLEAAHELKRLLPFVPLVMFTAFEVTDLDQRALKAGVAKVVSKSEPQTLISSIRNILDFNSTNLPVLQR